MAVDPTRQYPRTYLWTYQTASGDAAPAVTATVSAAGLVTVAGSASRAVTATVSAGGFVTFMGSASPAVTATVAAAGLVTVAGQASRAVAGTVSAAGFVTFMGSAGCPVTAAVSAGGSVTIPPGASSIPVAVAVAVAGVVTVQGQGSRALTVTVAAAGSVTVLGGAAVAVSAAVSAAGYGTFGGDVSLSVSAAVAATGYASGGGAVISGGAMPWTFFADSAVAPFRDIGPVQVVAFSADWQLSGFGAGEATIAVSSKSALSRTMLMQLWTWRLWAFYQGEPVWAGCPTGVVDQGAETVTVALSELPGYLSVKQYAINRTYTAVEQCTIAADLAAPLANIGVAVVTAPGAGQNRDRTYTFLEADRAQMLTDLSQVINGPEFRSEYAMGAGGAGCTLRIAYPRVGAAGNLAVVVPHGAISFRTTWTAGMMRTRTFAVGDLPPNAPTTATRPVVTIVAPQAGVPELDHVDDWPGVSVASTLNEYASSYAQVYAQPAMTLEAVMPLTAPVLGSYQVGDDVAVSLADPLVPSGLDAAGRLTALHLDAGSGTVTWTVSIAEPHPSRYATLSAQLKALHRKTAGIFHNSLAAPPGGINP